MDESAVREGFYYILTNIAACIFSRVEAGIMLCCWKVTIHDTCTYPKGGEEGRLSHVSSYGPASHIHIHIHTTYTPHTHTCIHFCFVAVHVPVVPLVGIHSCQRCVSS